VILVDTGPLLALAAPNDSYHHACVQLLRERGSEFRVPAVVIAEASYMIESRLGSDAEESFLRLFETGRLTVVDAVPENYGWPVGPGSGPSGCGGAGAGRGGGGWMRGHTAITGWVADVPAGMLAQLYTTAGATPAGPPSKSTIWRVLTDADPMPSTPWCGRHVADERPGCLGGRTSQGGRAGAGSGAGPAGRQDRAGRQGRRR